MISALQRLTSQRDHRWIQAKRGKRVAVPQTEAHDYLAKAEQFLRTAAAAHDSNDFDSAVMCAIHAGISATDAATVALAGIRSADPDHMKAADLLDEVAGGSRPVRTHASQLRQLLSKKSVVEYQSRRAREGEAADAVKRARRLLDWARIVVSPIQH